MMTKNIHTINLIFAIVGLVLSILGLVQILIDRFLDKRLRRFFRICFSILCFYTSCIIAREFVHDKVGGEWVAVSRFVLFGQAALASILTVLLTILILIQSGKNKWWKNGIFYVSFALWLIYIVLLVSNLFVGIIYTVDENNIYSRGDYFYLQIIPTILIMTVNIIALFMNREVLSSKQKMAFSVYSVVPMVAMIIQSKVFGVHFIALSTVLATLFTVSYIIADQTERYYVQQSENAQLKIDLLLAQIQPHFLYNSLLAIKYLCKNEPQKAVEGIDDFTIYLRHNMDSITIDTPIPFEEELKHVKSFLALQKLRFEEKLNIVYDIEYTDFSLPTLTLQPLVENAVYYGVRRNENGEGTVTVRTRKRDGYVEVSVDDNGPGFVTKSLPDEEEKTHTGIQNVRERLKRVSGGELRIDSELGKGTIATIIIRDE